MMTARDEQRLAGVHADLVAKLRTVYIEADARGTPLFVVQGVRTVAQQRALFAQGRTTPGPNIRPGHPLGDVVTFKDGVQHRSDHQPHADGLGHAVDSGFVPTPAQKDPFASTWPWAWYGAALKVQGLLWGGTFKGLSDLDHAELPDTSTKEQA